MSEIKNPKITVEEIEGKGIQVNVEHVQDVTHALYILASAQVTIVHKWMDEAEAAELAEGEENESVSKLPTENSESPEEE